MYKKQIEKIAKRLGTIKILEYIEHEKIIILSLHSEYDEEEETYDFDYFVEDLKDELAFEHIDWEDNNTEYAKVRIIKGSNRMIYVINEIADYGEFEGQSVIEGPIMSERDVYELYSKYYNQITIGCWSTKEFWEYKDFEEDRLKKWRKIWEKEGFNDRKYYECTALDKSLYAMNMLIKYHGFNKVKWRSI